MAGEMGVRWALGLRECFLLCSWSSRSTRDFFPVDQAPAMRFAANVVFARSFVVL